MPETDPNLSDIYTESPIEPDRGSRPTERFGIGEPPLRAYSSKCSLLRQGKVADFVDSSAEVIRVNGIYLFKFRGIPVFVSLWYLLLLAYFAMFSSSLSNGAIFAAAVTISILVHEFGHGLMARKFHLQPSILLHGWGGLCAHQKAKRDRDDALIVAAGPLSGLALGGIIFAIYAILGASRPELLAERPLLQSVFYYMLYINIGWSIINLIPLWPLDGGQLFALALKQKLNPNKALQVTHVVGLGLGVLAVIVGLWMQSFFIAIIAGFITYGNFVRLRNAPSARVERKPAFSLEAEQLYGKALDAMQSHDWEEATRLGHQMRIAASTEDQIGRAWELLAVASTNLGEYEEGLRYAQRAPDTEPVRQARQRCEEELGLSSA
ncbi:MAG: site-2 protease family protein [Myxococcota bacterium]|jgi:Zn-dependent protease|nr:site-2 protease family protein [Myxococcota bacterium]